MSGVDVVLLGVTFVFAGIALYALAQMHHRAEELWAEFQAHEKTRTDRLIQELDARYWRNAAENLSTERADLDFAGRVLPALSDELDLYLCGQFPTWPYAETPIHEAAWKAVFAS